MKKSSRSLSLILGITIALTAVNGCKKGGGAQSQKSSDEKVTVNFWENEMPKVQKLYDDLIKEFQKNNEKIEVKRTHYERGELKEIFSPEGEEKDKIPDVALVSNENLGELAAAKAVKPVADFTTAEGSKSMHKKAQQGVKFKGKEYMIPAFFNNQLILVYNKKLVSQPPQTFDELISATKKLLSEKKVKYGLVFNTADPVYTLPFLGAFGGKAFDDTNPEKQKLTLDTQSSKEWMAYMKKLMSEDIIPKEPDFNNADETFKSGSAAFLINGPNFLKSFDEGNVDFGVTSLPTVNGKYLSPYTMLKGYVVSSKVEDKDKKEGVKKFLEFLNKKDNVVKLAQAGRELPANTEAVKSDKLKGDQLLMMQLAELDKSILMPVMAELKSVKDSIASVQHDIFSDKIKLEDAPYRLQKKAEESTKTQEKK